FWGPAAPPPVGAREAEAEQSSFQPEASAGFDDSSASSLRTDWEVGSPFDENYVPDFPVSSSLRLFAPTSHEPTGYVH
ncbi:MAG: hypothetical protein ACKVJU_21155, partial [Verrucomicrobiales bacterium]